MKAGILRDFEELEKHINGCDRFEPLISMVDWVDSLICENRYPEEKPEVIKALKDTLQQKIKFQKEKLAGALDEEMVDIMTSYHGRHF